MHPLCILMNYCVLLLHDIEEENDRKKCRGSDLRPRIIKNHPSFLKEKMLVKKKV